MNKKTVCVDVDGVLAKYDGWKGIDHIGEPIEGAVEFTHKLGEKYYVMIFTTRCNAEVNDIGIKYLQRLIEEWLDKYEFYFNEVYVGQGKPIAVAYIDDRAINCTPQAKTAGNQYEEALQNVELVPDDYMITYYTPRKTQHQLRVEEFMRKADQEVPEKPIKLSDEVRILRAKLILEEALELIEDGLGVTIFDMGSGEYISDQLKFEAQESFDIEQIIDGCCDLSVVNVGTMIACGLPMEYFQEEIDRTNLEKFGEGGHKREDGKWIKPDNWKPPRIKEMLKDLKTGC